MGVPAFIRSFFDAFPLVELPAEPTEAQALTSGTLLYVYCIQKNDIGFSSYEPRCLASEMLISLNNDKVTIQEVSSLGTSKGRLPLLVELPQSPFTYVSNSKNKVKDISKKQPKKQLYSTFQAILSRWESEPWLTKEVQIYKTFVDTALHDFWVLSLLEADECLASSQNNDATSRDNLTSRLYMTSEEQKSLPVVVKRLFSREVHGVLVQELESRYPNIASSSEAADWLYSSYLIRLKRYRDDILTRATECVESISVLLDSSSGFVSLGPRIGSSPLGAIDVLVYCYVNASSLIPDSDYSSVLKPLRPHHAKVHKYFQA